MSGYVEVIVFVSAAGVKRPLPAPRWEILRHLGRSCTEWLESLNNNVRETALIPTVVN